MFSKLFLIETKYLLLAIITLSLCFQLLNSQAILSFTEPDSTVTTATEITVQYGLVYIIKDQKINKFNDATGVFDYVPSPPSEPVRISVTDNDVLYACTTNSRLYIRENSVWTQETLSGGPTQCGGIAVGYGNSFVGILNGSKTNYNQIINTYYKKNGKWIGPFNTGTRIATSFWKIVYNKNSDSGFYQYYNTEFDSTSTLRINKGGQMSSSEVDITNPYGEIFYYTYKSGSIYYLFQIDSSFSGISSFGNVVVTGMPITRVAAGRYSLPWIITAGKVQKSSCSGTKNYFDQKNYACVTQANCPSDTVVNSTTKTCEYGGLLDWTIADANISTAKEITIQGDYAFILLTNNSLYQYNFTTNSFSAKAPPSGKMLVSISVYKNYLYACTFDHLIYKYSTITSTWSAFSPNSPCVQISVNSDNEIMIMSTTSNGGDAANLMYLVKIYSNNTWTSTTYYAYSISSGTSNFYYYMNRTADKFTMKKSEGSWYSSTASVSSLINIDYNANLNVASDSSISAYKKDKVFFVYYGTLYFYNSTGFVTMNSVTALTNNLSVTRVSAPRNRPPWIIGSNGKVYKGSCRAPYIYFEEDNLCALTCPTDFPANSLKTYNSCENCKSYNQFLFYNTCYDLTNNLCSDITNAANGIIFK